MENGHANREDINQVLDACSLCLRVTQNQYRDLLDQLLEAYPDSAIEEYEAARNPYLEVLIPEGDIDIQSMISDLKKYQALLVYMLTETPIHYQYHKSLTEAKNNVVALINYLTQILMIARDSNGEDVVDQGIPEVPEDLRAGSNRSSRKTRDFVFVKYYSRCLGKFENFLHTYRNQV